MKLIVRTQLKWRLIYNSWSLVYVVFSAWRSRSFK